MTVIERRRQKIVRIALAVSIGLAGSIAAVTSIAAGSAGASPSNINKVYAGASGQGELDCNGFSPAQKPLRAFNCTDIAGNTSVSNQNTWGGRFYDNGHYIGHDEPDTTFLSSLPGSGNNVSWNLTLGADPSAAPTGSSPGNDVAHWFELSPAPWLSMAICDPNSDPQTSCTPDSDVNAPACIGVSCPQNSYPGGGSAFMEMQFYPPGNPPWIDSESCDGTHWCAALTIDSLECTLNFAQCNTNCEEPVNFAFIQMNGIPTGPPSPQAADRNSSVPNSETLLMNPGDDVSVHMVDAAVPGDPGKHALMIAVDDLTTGKSGFMQASAKNGFENTSIVNCGGTPFNFEPEYSTASPRNIIGWAALQTNISTEFETGHFEPCTSLSDEITNPFDPSDTGGTYNGCSGPYETAGGPEGQETGDAVCYQAGDVHPGYDGPGTTTSPDLATGCQDDVLQNGDLDFDGTPYWTEWPTSTSTSNKLPSSFVESLPMTAGQAYSKFFFQTDVALSEHICTPSHPAKCTVPPKGPGHFYPYWSESGLSGTCSLDFGNVSSGVNDYSKDAQYGTVQWATLGDPEFIGKTFAAKCPVTSP